MTDLAQQVRACLETSGHSQAEISRRLSISTKHMSQMLTGKASMSLNRAQQITAACGYRLTITITPDVAAIRAQAIADHYTELGAQATAAQAANRARHQRIARGAQ